MTKIDRKKRKELNRLAEQYPWLAMYAASFSSAGKKGGRPSTAFPRTSLSLRLTAGETKLVEYWRDIFADLLGKRPSRGEAVGLLAWLAKERYEACLMQQDGPPESLENLLNMFNTP